MKPYATFINSARGVVLKEDELDAVLKARPDLMALLDVTCPKEPPAPENPLWALPNFIFTPQIAGRVDRECARMGMFMGDELTRFIAGEPLE